MMNMLLAIAFLNAAVLSSVSADDEMCYEWEDEKWLAWIKKVCRDCKVKPTTLEMEQCLNENFEVVDEAGNVVPEKIRHHHYLIDLADTKISAMNEAMKDCGKGVEPLKLNTDENLKIVADIWECADAAMRKVCPEAYVKRTPYRDDVDIKGCLPSYF